MFDFLITLPRRWYYSCFTPEHAEEQQLDLPRVHNWDGMETWRLGEKDSHSKDFLEKSHFAWNLRIPDCRAQKRLGTAGSSWSHLVAGTQTREAMHFFSIFKQVHVSKVFLFYPKFYCPATVPALFHGVK